jgi:uncharacterized protein YcgL (UPF0745 family)
MSKPLHCFIYRSDRKADTYLYIVEKDNFEQVPKPLMEVFGQPEFSFEFELTLDRNLAKENSVEVYNNLQQQGFHLQMADNLLVEQQLALRSVN